MATRRAGQMIMSSGAGPESDMTPEEIADNARIEALRARDRERREKFIANPWQRKVGVDIEALNQQVAEKAARKERERHAERMYAQQQRDLQRQMNMMAMEEERAGSGGQSRNLQMWKEQAREKKEREARVREQDRRMASSSGMMFAGEDQFAADRKAMQRMQQRRWAEQQIAEKQQRKASEKAEMMADFQKYSMQNDMRDTFEQEDMLMRKQKADQIANENLLLARLRQERLAAEKREEEMMRLKEREAQKNNGLLAEDPDKAHSLLGAGRIRGDHFRGFSKDQLKQIKAEQAEQMAMKARQRAVEQEQQKREQRQQRELQRQMDIAALEQEDEEMRYQAQYAEQLKMQRQLEQSKKKSDRKERSNPGFSDGFFGGFGRSAR